MILKRIPLPLALLATLSTAFTACTKSTDNVPDPLSQEAETDIYTHGASDYHFPNTFELLRRDQIAESPDGRQTTVVYSSSQLTKPLRLVISVFSILPEGVSIKDVDAIEYAEALEKQHKSVVVNSMERDSIESPVQYETKELQRPDGEVEVKLAKFGHTSEGALQVQYDDSLMLFAEGDWIIMATSVARKSQRSVAAPMFQSFLKLWPATKSDISVSNES